MKAEFYLEIDFENVEEYKAFANKLSSDSHKVSNLIVKSVLGKFHEVTPVKEVKEVKEEKPVENDLSFLQNSIKQILETVNHIDDRVTTIAKDKYSYDSSEIISMLKTIRTDIKSATISSTKVQPVKTKPSSDSGLDIEISADELASLKGQATKTKFKPKKGRGVAASSSDNI